MEGDSTPFNINHTQSQEDIAMDGVAPSKKTKVTTETINNDHTSTTGQSINIVDTDVVSRQKQEKGRTVQIAAKNATTRSGNKYTRKSVTPEIVKSDDCIENGHDKRTVNVCKEETKSIDEQNINSRTHMTRRNKQLQQDMNLTPPPNSDVSKHPEKDQTNYNATEDSKSKVDNQGISLRQTPVRQKRSATGTQKLEPNMPQKKICVDKCQKKTPVRGKRKSEHDAVTHVTEDKQIDVAAKNRQTPQRGRQKSQITEHSKKPKLESRSKVNGKVTTTSAQQRGRKRAKKASGICVSAKGTNRSRAKKLKTGKQNETKSKSIKPFPELETDSEPIPDIANKSQENLIEALNIHLENKPTMIIKKRSRQVPKYCDKDLCDDTTTQSSALSESDSDSEEDDDDLPDVFSTPTSLNTACNFKPEDIVWAKMGKCPHWPAIIKSLQRKKHKASVYFIGYPQTKIRGISVSIKKLLHFNCPDRATYIEYGSKLQSSASSQFMDCVQRVDDYFRKRGLGTVTVTSPFEYFKEDESGDFSGLVGLPFFTDTLDVSEQEDNDVDNNSKQQAQNGRQTRVTKRMKAPKIVRRGTSCQRKMQKLLDFITKKDIVKDKLVGIANGSVENERHNIYMHGPNSKRKLLKHTGFGPIVDENQQEDLYRFLQSVYNEHVLEKTGGLTGVTYITEVWIPEAILMAIENERRVNRKKAVEIFFQEGDYHQSHNSTDLFDIPSIQSSPQQQVDSPQQEGESPQ